MRNQQEEQRERLRQEELKNNPGGAFNDGFNRAENGLVELVGCLGWKGIGIIILILVGYVLYKFVF